MQTMLPILVRDTQSEDCLYLSIYLPSKPSKEQRKVMVFFHGGAFSFGSSREVLNGVKLYDGKNLAEEGDLIVVTPQYRLGPLGYTFSEKFKEGKEGYGGNFGLLDCVAALKWVKREIGAFGGDGGEVTIFGESAGGHIVSLLSVMEEAEGLFKRVIVQSGLSTYYLESGEDREKRTERLGESFYCRRSLKKEDWIRCMQEIPAVELMLFESSSDSFFFLCVHMLNFFRIKITLYL